jgi:DUF309 family protein family protein
VNDPDGTPTSLDRRLLGGLTLIDRGEFHDAHELLEEVWAGEVGAERRLLQALIQVAVALHHRENGNLGGARALLLRAKEHLNAVGAAVLLGVDAGELATRCERLLAECIAAERVVAVGATPAPPIDRILLPRFDELRARIRAERTRRGLDPEPPIELPPP